MKILQINSVCGIRSTGRICTDIAQILQENGHECKIAYGRVDAPEQYQKYAHRIGGALNVLPHMLQAVVFDNAGFSSRIATKRLISWIKAYDPDIIHLHNIHGFYLHVGLLFQYLCEAKKPVIWTLHDCWPFTGHCAYFDYARCDRWESGCHHCPQKREYPNSYVFDRSERNYKIKKELFTSIKDLTIVTPSQWLADLVKRSYLKEANVKVIHNGIDLQSFHPVKSNVLERYQLQNKKIILGVASVWEPRKGLNDFYRLAEVLKEDYRIVLVGLNPAQIASLPQNIHGISRTHHVTELAELYTAATVLVNPTYDDNYPTVNLEAQACGTPVITYRTGGSVESVPSEHVVEQGDIEGLANAIYSIQDTEENCLERARDFDKTEKYYEYLRLYEQILEQSKT